MIMREFIVPKLFILSLAMVLTSCGGGGSSTPTPTPTPVAPTPPPPVSTATDLTQNKLLTDAELETSALNPVPTLNAAYQSWINDNHFPIRSITFDEDFSDLAFLKGLIGDRSLVQLGESSHGTAEFNHIKTRLIKYLHQEMDFNVVAFESGFFDGIYADSQSTTASADALMQFTFDVWQTNEVLEVFQYVQDTQTGNNPLRLIGFDTQISSSYYARMGEYIDAIPTSSDVPQTMKDTLKSDLAQFRQLQIDFSNQTCFQQSSSACQTAVDSMANVKNSLASAETDLTAISNPSDSIKILSIAVFAAMGQIDSSTATYARQDSNAIRDSNMALILGRIRNDLFPNEKIVVWAHNRHIAHQQSPTTRVSGQPFLIENPMGFYLKNDVPTDLYTIGLYMLRGSTADNSRRALQVTNPVNDSLEAIAHSVRKGAIFVDSQAGQTQTDGNKFLFEPIVANYWGGGFGSYRMTPSDQFDGLLIIDQSSTPSYR
jgi:erythromycin esterase